MSDPRSLESLLRQEGYTPDSEEYIGIDYGLGRSNVDPYTNIRYGVINHNHVLQAWCDSSEPFYIYSCPHCGHELKKGSEAKRCPQCFKRIDPEVDFDELEPLFFVLDDGEYTAQCGEDGDIFIIKSPYYTKCMFCSPCAPGAGDIMSPKKNGIKAYCFGPDFFDSGKAPYPVYRVDNNEEVK